MKWQNMIKRMSISTYGILFDDGIKHLSGILSLTCMDTKKKKTRNEHETNEQINETTDDQANMNDETNKKYK